MWQTDVRRIATENDSRRPQSAASNLMGAERKRVSTSVREGEGERAENNDPSRQVIGDEDWLNESSCDSQLARYLIWQKFYTS